MKFTLSFIVRNKLILSFTHIKRRVREMKQAGQPIQNEKQLETIKNILLQSSKRDGLLFVLAVNSGLKVSEILQLKVSDVIDENENVRHSILFYNEK